jgi:DNA-binding transcriptional ArsR family regulator
MATKRTKSRRAGKRGKRLRQVIDPELAKVLSHEIRGHILATLGDRVASPSEIAREIDVPVTEVSYHVRELRARKLIRLVRTEKRRGFREHFYELNSRLVYMDDSEWRGMPEQIRASLTASLLQIVMVEASDALRTGTFHARAGHQSRTPMIVDERAWGEVRKVMDDALERVLAIQEECSKTLEKRPGEGVPVEVFMLGFETAAGAVPDRALASA